MERLLDYQIAHYRLEDFLGEGGVGIVYRATDLNDGEIVALKVLRPYLAREPRHQQRFLREAEVVSSLSHPGIIQIREHGEAQGTCYLAMDYMPHGSLAAFLASLAQQDDSLALEEVLDIVSQAANALAYAHDQGLVHLDVKPGNILIKSVDSIGHPSRIVLSDFGIAALLRESGEGAVVSMGSGPYVAPEQRLGGKVDGRADLYALGAVLYQLTTGRLPFPVDSEGGDPLPPLPKSLNPQLPQALSQAIMTALAPSPEYRFPTGKDFVAGLMPVVAPAEAGEEDVAMPTPSPEELEWKTDPEPAAMSEQYEFSSNGSGSQDGDWVTIAAASPSLRSLNQRLLTIGRDTASDIFLDAPTVSMRHAALRRTREGWEVLDLDSTNGVFLDGTRLLPEVGERWLQHQTLRIGPFFLGLQMTEREHGEPASTMALNATLSPVNVKLQPGDREEVWIMLQNLTTERGYYQILLEDLPYGWFDLPKDVLQLSPGEQSELTLAIQPPRMGEVMPTIQKYKVLVRSMVNGDILARMAGSIEVRPVSTFALDWFPDELENQGVTRLVIHNQGNAAFDYRIVAISPDAPLLFGQMEAPPVETKPPRRRQLKMPKRIRGPRMPRFLMLIPGISAVMLRLNSLPFLRSARMVQSSTRRYSSLGTRISRSAGQSGGSAASAPPERAEHAYSAPTNKLPRKQRLEPEIDLNVEIPPGERRAVDIAVAAASRPLISAGEIIPFELRVLLDAGPSQSALSTISTRPRIPLWLSRLLFILLVVGLIAAVVYGTVNFCRNNEDTCRLPFVSQPAPGQMEEHAEMLRLDEKAQATPTPLAFPTATPSSQIALSTAVVAALSVADVDGSVSLNTVAISPTIWLGDDEDGNQYRAFISFDTSGLLPTMRLQQAEIRINRAGILGQPYARLGDVHMDVGPASGFGQDPALALADFMAPAQATNVVSLNRPGVNGEWLSGYLNESGLAAINRGGLTQFRLYFTLTHSMDLIADQLFLNSGNLEDPALHPQLILTYDEAP